MRYTIEYSSAKVGVGFDDGDRREHVDCRDERKHLYPFDADSDEEALRRFHEFRKNLARMDEDEVKKWDSGFEERTWCAIGDLYRHDPKGPVKIVTY